jgi:hypothetical protein
VTVLTVGSAGMSATVTPAVTAAMGAVRVDKAGVGSGVLNTLRQVGGSLGIAVIGALVASGVSASEAAGEKPPLPYLHGFQDGVRAAAFIALAGAVVAATLIRKTEHAHAVAPEAAAEI